MGPEFYSIITSCHKQKHYFNVVVNLIPALSYPFCKVTDNGDAKSSITKSSHRKKHVREINTPF